MTRRADIQALFQHGQRIERSSFVVLWAPAKDERRAAAFAVSRQIGGAVDRNRARRRLREAYRAVRDAAGRAVWLVIIAKRGALEAPHAAVVTELRAALAATARAAAVR